MNRALLLSTALALVACAHDRAERPVATGPFSTEPTSRALRLLHASDLESAVLPSGDAGGVLRFSRLAKARRASGANAILLSAGDSFMPAPALSVTVDDAPAPRRANALIGFAASGLGNHELDLGESYLADHVEGAGFPYLSSTVRYPTGPVAKVYQAVPPDAAAPWAGDSAGKMLSRAKACAGVRVGGRCDGVVVGLVSAVTWELKLVSRVEDADAASSLSEVKARLQAEVDALTREGVDIVILLSHLQDVRQELLLLEAGLVGVDLVVAGGGDDRLADKGDRLLPGDERAPVCEEDACYPLVRRAADGAAVLVVATDGQYRYLGELDASFDAAGRLTGFDADRSRPWPVDEESLEGARAPVSPALAALEEKVAAELSSRAAKIAMSAHWLEGRREQVRNRQTNLGDLSADAIQAAGQPAGAQLALRNGGGIRAPIGVVDPQTFARQGGAISQLDVEEALKFDGPLVVVTTTHAGLKATLERGFTGVGTGRGHFPQASAELYLEYAPACPEGERVRSARVRGATGAVEIVRDGAVLTPDVKISVATLAFLAKGGDGWFPDGAALEVKPLDATERSSFFNYLGAQQKLGAWKGGERYLDPVEGQPETFTRLRPVEGCGG